MWIPGRDQHGRACQRNNTTGEIKYPPFIGVIDRGVFPNDRLVINFYPDTDFTADAWEEYYDTKTNMTYWYNTKMDKSTWEDPGVDAKKQPPPPSSPPVPKRREADKWRKGKDGLWHNMETGESQLDLPACRVKFPNPRKK